MSESKQIDDAGPAFPTFGSATQIVGMSLLDYFAGQALVGLLASGDWDETPVPDAYLFATAMLNERERINAKRD